MRACWLCGDPVDAAQVYRVELEGAGREPRTVDIPGCVSCIHRFEASLDGGTTFTDVATFATFMTTPIICVFAIGLRSLALGAVAVLLLGGFAACVRVDIRRERDTTPRLTHEEGSWQARLSAQPDVAALLDGGWWLKAYPPRRGPEPSGGP